MKVRHAVLSLLVRPGKPDEDGVSVLGDASEGIKEGIERPVDGYPLSLRQVDRRVNFEKSVGRFPLPVAPGFFQFGLLREAIKTTFPRSMDLIAAGKVATA